LREFAAAFIVSLLGFIIGGVVGNIQIHSFFPYAWYGLLIALGLYIAVRVGADIGDIFD
jgi:hypothetical protein